MIAPDTGRHGNAFGASWGEANLPTLNGLVTTELSIPVAASVADMAAAIAARHPGAIGVLFYGSCLREASFDGLMLDFYLIVEDYEIAFGRRWLALANRLLPPNVFPFRHGDLVAKYAVLSAADFARLNQAGASTVSVWARFAQPSRVAWAADEPARSILIDAVAQAAPTLFALTIPMLDRERTASILDIWRKGFALTYAAELRAERANRPGSVVDADPARYQRFGRATLTEMHIADRLSPLNCAIAVDQHLPHMSGGRDGRDDATQAHHRSRADHRPVARSVPTRTVASPDPATSSNSSGAGYRLAKMPVDADEIVPAAVAKMEGRSFPGIAVAPTPQGCKAGPTSPAADADPTRPDLDLNGIAPSMSTKAASRRWRQLRRTGKVLTLARLAKASTTYAGGLDYLAWKIARHSGQPVAIRPWQRRWPILGALTLLPRLLLRGAVR